MLTLCLFSSDLIKAETQQGKQGTWMQSVSYIWFEMTTHTHTHTHTQPTSEQYSQKDPGAEEDISNQWTVVCCQFALNQSENNPKYLHKHTQTHTHTHTHTHTKGSW